MRYQMRVAREDDIKRMRPRSRELNMLICELEQQWKFMLQRGPAWTLDCEGEPVAAGGATIFWPGVAEVWLFLSDVRTRPIRRVIRAIQSGIEALEGAGLERLQASIPADDIAAIKFAKLFGFEREATLRRYLPDGRDAALMVRFAGGR